VILKIDCLDLAKKLDQISKKSISTVISNDASFQKRKSKSFDYAIIHTLTNIKTIKSYMFLDWQIILSFQSVISNFRWTFIFINFFLSRR
jgi:predicted transcriptional regulator